MRPPERVFLWVLEKPASGVPAGTTPPIGQTGATLELLESGRVRASVCARIADLEPRWTEIEAVVCDDMAAAEAWAEEFRIGCLNCGFAEGAS